ncbi:DNA repair protein RAD51 homolog 4-like [Diadema antillarum]|uniref:DNA repair protein RAD51 homolog 4-like n=1 Tax=Diadema antillarum TaxID=105358 RepID=UPI003A8BCA90
MKLNVGMCPAMTKDVYESLQSSGVKTVLDFITSDVELLSQRCSLSYKVLLSIRRLLLAQYAAFPINGTDHYDEMLSTVACLATGCQSIDALLDGGIYTSELTEIVGPAASGKTQFCLTVASSVALSGQNVLYIDTSGAFDPSRLQEIVERRVLTEKERTAALCKIRCAKTFDLHELLDLVDSVKAAIDQGTDAFYGALKLVIVDSVTAVLAPLLGGKQSEGQGMMVHLARSLKFLAADYSVAVVECNNMVQGEKGVPKPALGRTWLSVPQTRLLLTMERGERITSQASPIISRAAYLVKSQRQAVSTSCQIAIGDEGVNG